MKAIFSLCIAILLFLVGDSYPQRFRYNCTTKDVKHPLRFLGFFPCSPDSNRDLNECDMLTLSAVELAIDKINHDPNILSCFKLELLPVFSYDPIQDLSEIISITYADSIHGVLGSNHASTSKSIAYILGRLNILQISYSVTDPSLEDTSRYPYFYATVPDDHFLNKVRRNLLEHFSWKRVGIFSIEDEYHVSLGEFISSFLRNNDSHMTVLDLGSFSKSPEKILNYAKLNDVRVLLPILGESHARNVFCVAYNLKLTTADHVWILPGMYNTKWWYLEDNDTTSNCTNEQILEAINSTLFVDTFPFNINMKSKVDDVLTEIFYNVALNISANMTMEEYSSLIIHSKLLNAYDATIALALTWNASLSKIENEFLNDDIFSVIDNPWYHPHLGQILQDSLENSVSPYNGLAGIQNYHHFDKNHYSQGLVTQLIGKRECILRTFQTIQESVSVSYICENNTRCCDASWKGGYLPADGNLYSCSFVGTGFLVTIGIMAVWYIVGIIAGLVLLLILCMFKGNKHIKATSPKFNVILNLSICGMFVSGLILLALFYLGIKGIHEKTTAHLCDAFYTIWYISTGVFFSTLLVKNWRLYRIFHNPKIRSRKYLSDRMLLLGLLLFIFPLIAVIITKLIYRPFFALPFYIEDDCPDASVQDTRKIEYYCANQYKILWFMAGDVYLVMLFIAILLLALNNLKVISYFKKEGEQSSLIIIFGTFFLLLCSFTINFYFSQASVSLEYSIIFYASSLAVIATFLLLSIYVPKFLAIARDQNKAKQKAALLTKQIHLQKCEEIVKLKTVLFKIELMLASLSGNVANESQLLQSRDRLCGPT